MASTVNRAVYMPSGAPVTLRAYVGGTWVPLGGEVTGRVPSPPDGPLRNIGTRMATANGGGRQVPAGGFLAGTKHTLAVDATSLRFEWDLARGQLHVDRDGTYRAAYSLNGGAPVNLTFGGSESFTASANQVGVLTVAADPVERSFFAGDVLTVWSWVSIESPGQPYGSITGTLENEVTNAGSWGNGFAGASYDGTANDWALRPARIIAPSNQPAWVIGGDSIMQQHDSFIEQALGRVGVPAVKTAQGGEAYAHFPERWALRYGKALEYADHMVDELGINDTNTTDWVEGIAKKAIAHWGRAREAGVKVLLKTTLTLYAQSTDNWSTLKNQSTPGDLILPARVGFNRWLRDGAPLVNGEFAPAGTAGATRCAVVAEDGTVTPGTGGHLLDGVLDVAAAIEEGETGKYRLAVLREAGVFGKSMDGLHPAAGVHRILSVRAERDMRALGYL